MNPDDKQVGGSLSDMAKFMPGQFPAAPSHQPAADQPGAFGATTPVSNQSAGQPMQASAAPAAGPHESNSTQTGVSNTTTPMMADDNDLIEKEWVDSVKNVVEKTRTNPFEQSQEISRLRTEYLQKRYGKTMEKSE
jgi:hypothetical protein